MTDDKSKFGVAGFPVSFFKSPYGKKRENIFRWVNEIGLDVLELQCTYGIRMSDCQALRYRGLAVENNIIITIHAPYYVNLGSKNQQTVSNSKNEIIKAFKLANLIGAKRIIFHPGGGYGKTIEEREIGVSQIIKSLNEIKSEINTKDVKIYPETGGKVASLGSLDEIIRICKGVDYAYPCLDLAHLHAREGGSLINSNKILNVLNIIEKKLGRDYLEKTHFHMYPVDYTIGGEKTHKAFSDIDDLGLSYFPLAQDFVKALKDKKIYPIVICEAYNSQDIGAILMKELVYSAYN